MSALPREPTSDRALIFAAYRSSDVRKRKVQKHFHEQEGRNGIDETATNDCAAGRN